MYAGYFNERSEKTMDKRIMIVGTGSGCGKTTVTCGIMKALKNKNREVAPFKCGPDYIDPMFHKHITGKASINLDLFFLKPEMLCWILNKHLGDGEIGVIEGVMGLYDGIGTSITASAYDVAMTTKTPMILVVNAKGMAASVCAMIRGYQTYGDEIMQTYMQNDGANHTLDHAGLAQNADENNCIDADVNDCIDGVENPSLIKGVILNHVGQGMYDYLKDTIESQCGVKVLGYMPEIPEASIESRHLGLVTAEEIENLDKKVELLGQTVQKTIDLEALEQIAAKAEPLAQDRLPFEAAVAGVAAGTQVNLAVAMDKAFCFYYEDNLELFKSLGIHILPFSPLAGEQVPKEAHGIYIGGGYPELYLEELQKQLWVKFSIRNCWSKHMPIIAECGGFMYLHDAIEDKEGQSYRMVGIIPGKAKMTEKLGPFGYINIEMPENSLFGEAPTVLRGHEFHYSISENDGGDLFVSKPNGKQWSEGFCKPYLYAAYPHLYFYSNIDSAIHFKQAMISYKKNMSKIEA